MKNWILDYRHYVLSRYYQVKLLYYFIFHTQEIISLLLSPMLLWLLLIPLQHVLSYDGCDGFEWLRCGDTCSTPEKVCTCGDQSSTLQDYLQQFDWCCITSGSNCSTNGNGDITCPTGTRQSLTKPCQGNCNHWPKQTWTIGYREFIFCDYSLNVTSGQCLKQNKYGDNKYDCWDRSDEQPFKEKEELSASLLTKISECKDAEGNPGFKCSLWRGKCLPKAVWCIPNSPFSCPEELGAYTTSEPTVCGDYQFWSGHTCWYKGYGDGKRCTGRGSGQCVHKEADQEYARRFCEDKSDQVFTKNSSCPSYSLQTSPYCSAELKKYCIEMSYTNETYWYYCLSCFDPAKCVSSCAPSTLEVNYSATLQPYCQLVCDRNKTSYDDQICSFCLGIEPGCEACNNQEYFQCEESGQCVHQDLRCDMHPQCRFGEDEKGCLQEYKDKGFVREEALYQ